MDKNYKELFLNFLPSKPSEYDKYNKIYNVYLKDINFNNNYKEFENLLNKKELDLFLILVLNIIISYFPLSKKESLNSYKNFCKFVKTLFKNNKVLKLNNLSKILFLFFDFDTNMNKLKSKIIKDNKKIDLDTFETLLYGFRFCSNSLYYEKDEIPEKNKKFFSSLLLSSCQNIIEKSLIPGIDHKKDMHLITLEYIQNHFTTFNPNFGCYVCSCGFYYTISPCGFPTQPRTFPCLECHQLCGWGPKVKPGGPPNQGMVIREGHYRIFKNQEEKVKQFERYNESEENIPNLIYDDYIKNIIEPIRKKKELGFGIMDRDYFEDPKKEV